MSGVDISKGRGNQVGTSRWSMWVLFREKTKMSYWFSVNIPVYNRAKSWPDLRAFRCDPYTLKSPNVPSQKLWGLLSQAIKCVAELTPAWEGTAPCRELLGSHGDNSTQRTRGQTACCLLYLPGETNCFLHPKPVGCAWLEAAQSAPRGAEHTGLASACLLAER